MPEMHKFRFLTFSLLNQERATKANKSGGKLANQLSAQKKQTQNQLLNSGSEAERRARDADEAAQNRSWN